LPVAPVETMLGAARVFVSANDLPLLVDADGSPTRRAGDIDNLEYAVAVNDRSIAHRRRSRCEVEPARDPAVGVDPIEYGVGRDGIIDRDKVIGDGRVQFLNLLGIRDVSLLTRKMGRPARPRSHRPKQGLKSPFCFRWSRRVLRAETRPRNY